MFYVYVLHSLEDRGFYIGFSTDLGRRMSEHKQGASFATKYRGPWKLTLIDRMPKGENGI
jgi:predicted GIY-YIG superfamily endonuclease